MADKIYTTLAQIRAKSPCADGYKKLYTFLGGIKKYGKDKPVTFRQIYESNGYEDTIWCVRTIDKQWDSLVSHFAYDCADDVKHLMTGERWLKVIKVSRLFADGEVAQQEFHAAAYAAYAAYVAYVARHTAAHAAYDAAYAAFGHARHAAGEAARHAAGEAAGEAQVERWFKYCKTGERVRS